MSNKESALPGLIFLGVMFGVGQLKQLEVFAIFITLGMFFCAYLAKSLLRACFVRLGRKAWSLAGQLALWVILILTFTPLTIPNTILLLWGIGLPALLLGMGTRWGFDRAPEWLTDRAKPIGGYALGFYLVGVLVIATLYAEQDLGRTIEIAIHLVVLSAIPAVYGWVLGEGYPANHRDARFGDAEDLRRKGFGDEF